MILILLGLLTVLWVALGGPIGWSGFHLWEDTDDTRTRK